MTLWRRLARYIESGKETPKVDLKLSLDLSSRIQRAEFAKDVTAIANTPGGDGYLIIGVKDIKDRVSDNVSDYVVGFDPGDPDQFHRQMVDALTMFCNRVPLVDYDQIRHPATDRRIGVVHIHRSFKKPHGITRASGPVKAGQIWIRRGTATYLASVEEIENMVRNATHPVSSSIVINLSTRPLTELQIKQIEQETYIEELIEVPVRFEASPGLDVQIQALVEQLGFAPGEWQQKSIVIHLPGLSAASAALLAHLHGMMGHFPKVLWLRPTAEDASIYEVGQVLRLQDLRDVAHLEQVQAIRASPV
jgi:hypothetical protein